jgi:hypothetical protein
MSTFRPDGACRQEERGNYKHCVPTGLVAIRLAFRRTARASAKRYDETTNCVVDAVNV